MTREEINALLEAYRDGTLAADEGAALAGLLDGGTEEAAWACAHWAVMGQLGQALDGVDGDAMAASFQERLRAETSGSRIVRGVERLRAADARGRSGGAQRAPARRRRRVNAGVLAAAALVLLAVTAGLAITRRAGAPPREDALGLPLATVTALSGAAERVRAGQASALGIGATLAPGDRLQVAAAGAVALRYADGSELSVDAGGILDFISAQAAKQLHLRAGALHAQVAHQRDGAPLVVETAFARCEVIGTTFAIDASAAATRLTVYAGRVRCAASPAAGTGTVEVAANQYVLAAPGTALAVHDLAAPPTAVAPAPGAPPTRLIDGFEQESPWTHEPYSGPLALARSGERAHSGSWSLRIDYQRDVSELKPYAQVLHPLVLMPGERTIRLWMLVEAHQEDARWQLQLHDRDNCYWKTAIRPFDAAPGWHELRIAIPEAPERAFAPPGHEADPFVRGHIDAMALNFFGGDAVLFIDDIEMLAEP